jgi:mannose-6-phosphate isomerase-like protein (cupin superfamily)
MTAPGYDALHLDDVEALDYGSDVPLWKPLRHRLGVESFGINAYLAPRVGDLAVEPHDETTEDGTPGHQEIYLVVRGAARFTAGDDTFDVRAGGLVFLRDPALHREAVATEDDTLVLAVGAAPGVAFEPSAWEARWLAELGRN